MATDYFAVMAPSWNGTQDSKWALTIFTSRIAVHLFVFVKSKFHTCYPGGDTSYYLVGNGENRPQP